MPIDFVHAGKRELGEEGAAESGSERLPSPCSGDACPMCRQPPSAVAAGGTATWMSAPAQAPPPPDGTSPSPFPLPVGYVGDIEFWAPNRGVLITAGNSVVPAGLYAYDGVNWHQLSTRLWRHRRSHRLGGA